MTPRRQEKPAIRLNRYLASAGITSRRKADELIRQGQVRVNGKPVTALGTTIDPSADRVMVGAREVVLLDEPVYIVLNKPKDTITTTHDERGRHSTADIVRVRERIFPVGRLDRNTTGVLLLTNDGEFANLLMHPRHGVTKAYRVTIDKPLAREHASELERGVRLKDGMTGPAEVHIIPGGKHCVIGIVIHEGKNRQVHRMFEKLGYSVEKLDRVAYGGLTIEGLPRGRWRYLTKGEVARLRSNASGDAPGSGGARKRNL